MKTTINALMLSDETTIEFEGLVHPTPYTPCASITLLDEDARMVLGSLNLRHLKELQKACDDALEEYYAAYPHHRPR
jgi:hypothetical protein